MSDLNLLNIATRDTAIAIGRYKGTLKDVLKRAMRYTKNHWLVTDDDLRLRAAIGATMAHFGEGSEEWETLKREFTNLQRFGAAMSAAQLGVKVDFTSVDFNEKNAEPIGIVKLWNEVKEEK